MKVSKEALAAEFRPSWLELSRSVFDGLKSRILGALASSSNHTTNKVVATYYAEHRYHETDVDIVDGATSWYSEFAYSIVRSASAGASMTPPDIVEFGCGQGSFISWAYTNNFDFSSYLGIDLHLSSQQIAKSSQKVSFLKGDINAFIPDTELMDRGFSLLAVNTFCYLQSLDTVPLLDRATDKIGGAQNLYVVEPYPSLFWENYFSGIHIALRSPIAMVALMESKDWEATLIRKLYLFRLGGLFIWPISYSLYLSRKSIEATL